MSLSGLPDGCLQHVLDFLNIRDVAVCAATCKRMSTLAKLPLMWIPRLKADFGVAIKVCLGVHSCCLHLNCCALGTGCKPASDIELMSCVCRPNYRATQGSR